MNISTLTLSDDQLQALQALMGRTPGREWRLINPKWIGYTDPVAIRIWNGQSDNITYPKARIEELLALEDVTQVEDNEEWIKKIAQVRVYDEETFVMMVVNGLVTIEQISTAHIEHDGSITIGEVAFCFPDRVERVLTVILDLQSQVYPIALCTADGKPTT
jgi:hypothetical protein